MWAKRAIFRFQNIRSSEAFQILEDFHPSVLDAADLRTASPVLERRLRSEEIDVAAIGAAGHQAEYLSNILEQEWMIDPNNFTFWRFRG